MDWRIIVPIVVVLALIVAMGKNPFEPPPGWKPTDPFQQGIEDKLQAGNALGNRFGNNDPAADGTASPFGAGAPSRQAQAPAGNLRGVQTGNSASGGLMSGGMMQRPGVQPTVEPPKELPPMPATQRPAAPGSQPAPFRGLPMPAADPQSSYTPQRPASGMADSVSILPGSSAAPALKNGQPVSFSGPQVFITDASGQRTPLPDGEYATSSGGKLIIRGGKQQLPPYYFTRLGERGNSGS